MGRTALSVFSMVHCLIVDGFPAAEDKKAPLKLKPRGAISRVVTCANVPLNTALMGSAGGD